MKTCAVMQPYLFPYIGYYQLIYASNVFVSYDDVNFIKKSYINRNSILLNGKSHRFSLSIHNSSQNVLIKDLNYASGKKIFKSIEQGYKKSPYYQDAIGLIASVFLSEERNVGELNTKSLSLVFEYLGLDTNIVFSSDLDYNRDVNRAEKLINLTKKFDCDHYINSPGGKTLYDKNFFQEQGVKLNFIESNITPYKQISSNFTPYLSMIDILMNCSKKQIIEMLINYELS